MAAPCPTESPLTRGRDERAQCAHAAAAIALDDIESAWRSTSDVLAPSPNAVASAASASGSWTDGLLPTLHVWLDASIAAELARRTAARSVILATSDPPHVAPPSHA